MKKTWEPPLSLHLKILKNEGGNSRQNLKYNEN